MTESPADVPDASESPVTGDTRVPVPRLATPATETPEESLRAEADAVGDHPDVGGLTPADDAQ